MSKLEGPDKMHLEAAEGWLELGNYQEANDELEKITPELRGRVEVLFLRLEIYQAAGKWDYAADLARILTEIAPKDPHGWMRCASSLHKLGRTQAAWDFLLPLAERFPGWGVRYDLACYACQLGRLKEAFSWLERAIDLAGKEDVKTMALNDTDLEPLWLDISEI